MKGRGEEEKHQDLVSLAFFHFIEIFTKKNVTLVSFRFVSLCLSIFVFLLLGKEGGI